MRGGPHYTGAQRAAIETVAGARDLYVKGQDQAKSGPAKHPTAWRGELEEAARKVAPSVYYLCLNYAVSKLVWAAVSLTGAGNVRPLGFVVFLGVVVYLALAFFRFTRRFDIEQLL